MQVRFKQSNRVPCSGRGVPRTRAECKQNWFRIRTHPVLRCQANERSDHVGPKERKLPWPVFLFLLALVVPWLIYIGPLRMSLYRIVLLVMILPCLGMWMTGKAGRIRTADIALLAFSFWCMLSFIVVNGMALSVQTIGINFIETLGPYLLARCYIRDADDFYNVFQLLFMIVVLLLPFAFFEFVSGQNISRELFAAIFPTFSYWPAPPRLGFTRVQSVFDHPILFGTCTGGIFALVHLVLGYQKSFFHRTLKTGIVGATSILSLSSGPLTMIVIQGLLLSWNWLLGPSRFRWKILIGLLVVIILSIEVVANRSIPATVSRYLAFDQRVVLVSHGDMAIWVCVSPEPPAFRRWVERLGTARVDACEH